MVSLDSAFALDAKNELKNGIVGAALRTVGPEIAGSLLRDATGWDLNAVLSARRGVKRRRIRPDFRIFKGQTVRDQVVSSQDKADYVRMKSKLAIVNYPLPLYVILQTCSIRQLIHTTNYESKQAHGMNLVHETNVSVQAKQSNMLTKRLTKEKLTKPIKEDYPYSKLGVGVAEAEAEAEDEGDREAQTGVLEAGHE